MRKDSAWYLFQEQICEHFISIGAEAKTNVTIKGVRTTHDIDVLVKTKFLGEDLIWVIEAKKWKHKVNKLQVLGLRTIVNEIGADRGFIISEAGFQKGAIEAANNTNIRLKTFTELKNDTRELVGNEILKTLRKRYEISNSRYWSHSKRIRQKYSLRDDAGVQPEYSGGQILMKIESVLSQAEKHNFPINLGTVNIEQYGEQVADNINQAINWLNFNFNILDEKIIKAEIEMIKNNDFNPRLTYPHP
jgi:hypothetical protein